MSYEERGDMVRAHTHVICVCACTYTCTRARTHIYTYIDLQTLTKDDCSHIENKIKHKKEMFIRIYTNRFADADER
jgi:hypothetical protein